jgi:hypothetical protein
MRFYSLVLFMCVAGNAAAGEPQQRAFVVKDLNGATLRLHVGEEIGRGYFGHVHRAVDDAGKPHAVKFLNERWLKEWKRESADFSAESRVLRAIKDRNPHLVGGLGAGELEGAGPKVTGVHIDWAGENMQQLGPGGVVAQRAPGKAARIVREVLNGLVELHGLGMAHEDIGPGNILIDHNDATASVKVIDPANGSSFSRSQNQQLDVQQAATLLVRLINGEPFDGKSKPLLKPQSSGIPDGDVVWFRDKLAPVLDQALAGNLTASQFRDALAPFCNHARFR